MLFTASGLPGRPHTLTIEVDGDEERGVGRQHHRGGRVRHHDAPPDTTPPTVTITTPTAGTTVFGTVPVTASASGQHGRGRRTVLRRRRAGRCRRHGVAVFDQLGYDDGHRWVAHADGDGAGRCRQHHDIGGRDRDGVQRVSAADVDGDAVREDGPVDHLHAGDGGSCGQPPDWWHGSRSRGWSLGTASFNRSAGRARRSPSPGRR